MSEQYKVRIKFSKHGAVKYIGHLDVMRFFQKAFRRAEMDIVYTGGFSPHQVMSFASPLGVGLESDGEYLDVELSSLESTGELVQKLNEQMSEGLEVLSARILPDKTGSAMASVAAAGYYIGFREEVSEKSPVSDLSFPGGSGGRWQDAIEDFLAQEHIWVEKQTKKNTLSVDIRPAIYDFRLSSYQGADCPYLLVNASSSGNIKPAMVMEALFRKWDMPFDASRLRITREDTYLNTGTPEKAVFVPMDAIGMEK